MNICNEYDESENIKKYSNLFCFVDVSRRRALFYGQSNGQLSAPLPALFSGLPPIDFSFSLLVTGVP
jgi:hypothetical protein